MLKMKLPESYREQFEPELIAEIERIGKPTSVKAGTVILETGQLVKIIPLLISGILRVSRVDEEGRDLLLYYVHANESCAMTFTCCMQQYPSEVKVTAESDVEMIFIPISQMDSWLNKYSTWKAFVMKTIRNRFNELLKAIDQIAFHKLDERLVNYLKDKSKATGSSLVNLSHEQIASELATSRVVVSRLLKKLEDDKKVLLYRNQVKLLQEL